MKNYLFTVRWKIIFSQWDEKLSFHNEIKNYLFTMRWKIIFSQWDEKLSFHNEMKNYLFTMRRQIIFSQWDESNDDKNLWRRRAGAWGASWLLILSKHFCQISMYYIIWLHSYVHNIIVISIVTCEAIFTVEPENLMMFLMWLPFVPMIAPTAALGI